MKLVRSRGQWFVGGLMLLSSVSSRAGAQGNPAAAPDAEARAQALFLEAWRLMDQQRPGEACVMFRRALELKRSPSILNNVGRCFRQENDLVSAMETFQSSVALAEQQPPGSKRDSWLDGARQEMKALQPQLARLELQLPSTPGLVIAIDGKTIAPGAAPAYLRPGEHVLSASAPDRVSHRAELQLVAGVLEQYQVPALLPLPASPSPLPASPSAVSVSPSAVSASPSAVSASPSAVPSSSSPLPASAAEPPWPSTVEAAPARSTLSSSSSASSTRVLPWALIGTGSTAVFVGVVTGLMASAKGKELERGCPDGSCPNPRSAPGWQDKIDGASRMALVTDVLWGVGLATLGAGITLLVLDGAGDQPAEQTEVQASCRSGGCGLGVSGSF